VDAVDESVKFAGVDEERLPAPVAENTFGVGGFVFTRNQTKTGICVP
jgi:hypothetical protein